jgi:hypothetical protein
MLSPTLEIIVRSRVWDANPRINFIDPVPPARTVINDNVLLECHNV